MIVKFHATAAGVDGVFCEGEVWDLPSALAKEYLNAKHAASRPGHEIPAATLVTDPKERAKAKPYRKPASEETELDSDGWTTEGN